MAKREFSAGGIVFRKKNKDDFEVLLIKDAYGHWTWPKGNIEQNEQSQDAALREIKEETGLKNLRILRKFGRTNYFYRLKEELVFKTVFFFLIETDSREKLRIQKSEIRAASWFKPQAALKIVNYKGAREMLDEAIAMYRSKSQCSV